MPICVACGTLVQSAKGFGSHYRVCPANRESVTDDLNRFSYSVRFEDENVHYNKDIDSNASDDDSGAETDAVTEELDELDTDVDEANVRAAAVSATIWREHHFASEVVVQDVKRTVADYDRTLRAQIAGEFAAHFDLPLEEVRGVVSHAVNAFEVVQGRRHEKTIADRVISPVYPYRREVGKTVGLGGQTIVHVVAEHKVEELLQQMLSDEVLLSDCMRDHPPFDGVVRDVRDSVSWRCHPMADTVPNPFFFLLYADGVELCCPIGQWRGKHKFIFGYWVLLNLSPEHRFTLLNIQLAFICHEETMEHFGPCAIISGEQEQDGTWKDDTSFGASMRRFAKGLHLDLPEPYRSHVQYGALIQVAGDGLEKHTLLGSKKSVSIKTKRICCNCNVTSDQRHVVFDFHDPACPLTLTTTASHERDLKLVQQNPEFSKHLGVAERGSHAFEGIVPGLKFDFVPHTPYDHIMHSEAEGFLKDHTKITLGHLFKSDDHAISLNGSDTTASFNETLKKFDWSEDDKHNAPKCLKEKYFSDGDGKIPWTASMVLVFAFHSIALLAAHVDTADPVWVCWCLHVYYVQFAWKNSFTWDEILHLNDAIRKHHTMFVELFPDDVIPKFHWVLHLAYDVWLNGPPKHISCLRPEAKHQYWKRLVAQLNFKGCLAMTMARRHARSVALERHRNPTSPPHVQSTGYTSAVVLRFSAGCSPGSLVHCLMQIPALGQAIQPESQVTFNEHSKLKWVGQVSPSCGL